MEKVLCMQKINFHVDQYIQLDSSGHMIVR